MIYRVLGGAAILVGVIFGIITLLVLLPFLNNFSTSLLILAAVFAVLAYVFLAIGWQLVHPPAQRRRRRRSKYAPEERAGAAQAYGSDADLSPADDVMPPPPVSQAEGREIGMEAAASQPWPAPEPLETEPEAALLPPMLDQPAPTVVEPIRPHAPFGPPPAVEAEPVPGSVPATTFSGFGEARPLPGPGELAHTAVREAEPAGADDAGDGATPGRVHFKKPGAPIPERHEPGR